MGTSGYFCHPQFPTLTIPVSTLPGIISLPRRLWRTFSQGSFTSTPSISCESLAAAALQAGQDLSPGGNWYLGQYWVSRRLAQTRVFALAPWASEFAADCPLDPDKALCPYWSGLCVPLSNRELLSWDCPSGVWGWGASETKTTEGQVSSQKFPM